MLDGTQVLDWALPPAIEEGFQATLVPEETAISEPKQVIGSPDPKLARFRMLPVVFFTIVLNAF